MTLASNKQPKRLIICKLGNMNLFPRFRSRLFLEFPQKVDEKLLLSTAGLVSSRLENVALSAFDRATFPVTAIEKLGARKSKRRENDNTRKFFEEPAGVCI